MDVRYVLSRLLQGLAVIVTVIVIVFVVLRVAGDPVDILLPITASEEARDNLRHQLGLDRPLLTQFGDFATDVVRLDFGDSYRRHSPALPIVLGRFGKTVELVGVSIALAALTGVLAGAVAAMRPNGLVDRLTTFLAMVSVSVPQFWLGLVVILIFAVGLGLLPSSGSGGVRNLILPAVTMAIPPAGRFAAVTRSVMSDELGQEYIRMDRSRGLPRWRVLRHALRGTTVTLVSVIGYETVNSLAGHSIVVETVFAWPGIGRLVTESLAQQDLPLIQAVVGFIALLVVCMNLVLDIVYSWIDPRISRGEDTS